MFCCECRHKLKEHFKNILSEDQYRSMSHSSPLVENEKRRGTPITPPRVGKYRRKAPAAVRERNLMSNSPELYLETMKGGKFQIILCEQSGKESFLHPFHSRYFNKADRHAPEFERLKTATNIIALAPKRVSKAVNDSQYKEDNGFKKSCLVRYCEDGFDVTKNYDALTTIAEVRDSFPSHAIYDISSVSVFVGVCIVVHEQSQ